jgi:hypothetical protein
MLVTDRIRQVAVTRAAVVARLRPDPERLEVAEDGGDPASFGRDPHRHPLGPTAP